MYIKVFLACYNNIHHTARKCAVAGFDKYNAFDVLIILSIGRLLPGTPRVCTKLYTSLGLCSKVVARLAPDSQRPVMSAVCSSAFSLSYDSMGPILFICFY